MDYAKTTDAVNILLKSAAPEGGTTKDYEKIPGVDEQRDIIVSHLKSTYTTETGEMLNAKEVVDSANTYRHMLNSSDEELGNTRNKIKRIKERIATTKLDMEKAEKVRNILQILTLTVVVAIGIYLGLGYWGHTPAFFILLAGLMYVLYTRGESVRLDSSAKFPDIIQWMYKTIDLWPTSKSSRSQDTYEPTSTK
jgi:uncharacterized membrane-anchored protein YhcB (DUF1043 family)